MKPSQHKRSLWLGSLAAVVVPPLCFLVSELLKLWARESANLFSGSVIFLTIAIPVALLAMVFLGLPYVLWLRARGRLNAVYLCLSSTAIGCVWFWLLSSLLSLDPRSPGLLQLAWGAGLGLVAGAAFSLAAGLNVSPLYKRSLGG